MNPQFLSTVGNSLENNHVRHKCIITLHLGRLHLDGTSDYYMLSLPPNVRKSELEQVGDIAEDIGETLVLHIIGKVPIGKLKVSELLKVGKALFSFGEISDPEEHPKATIAYYPNETFGTTTGGDIASILFIIKNKRLSSVGFDVAQDYYHKDAWVPIDIDLKTEPVNERFGWLPGFLRKPLVVTASVVVGGTNVLWGTAETLIEGANNLIVKGKEDPITVSYKGEWNLEEAWAVENGAAAPRAQSMSLADYPPFQRLSPEMQEYLLQLVEEPNFGKTMTAELQAIPEQTSLLPNYPNPFNPETWIPYQLSEPADVTLTIYDIHGRVVRALDLGHPRAGMYHSRSRAASWDGRNEHGEPVASGIYFYTLSAGDFTTTRKMLIRK